MNIDKKDTKKNQGILTKKAKNKRIQNYKNKEILEMPKIQEY